MATARRIAEVDSLLARPIVSFATPSDKSPMIVFAMFASAKNGSCSIAAIHRTTFGNGEKSSRLPKRGASCPNSMSGDGGRRSDNADPLWAWCVQQWTRAQRKL